MPNVVYNGMIEDGETFVMVERDGVSYQLPIRFDLVNHSPDGHSWGYGGSGPAQCAAALLADYFSEGKNPEYIRPVIMEDVGTMNRDNQESNQHALKFYQDFKFSVLANFPMDSTWRLEGEQVKLALLDISAFRNQK